MFKKIRDTIKQYIRENYRFLITLLCLYLFLAFPLPYYIYTGGGIIPIKDRIEIDTDNKEKGSFNLAYVSEIRGTPFYLLLSHVFKDWEVVKEEDYKLNEEESEEDILFRNKIALEQANQNAILFAYQKAGKKTEVLQKNFYVLYIDDNKKAPLQVGDQIVNVDGKPISSLAMYQEIVQKSAVGDKITLSILRKDKPQKVSVEVFVKEGRKMTGLSIQEVDAIKTNPKISFHFKEIESGPSGGLMMALAIYNRLTKQDYTAGKKIVGTGTLEADGTVGEIGGVLYKLRGAVSKHADIFIVPSGENYEDCLEEVQKRNYKIKLLAVDTFDDAVSKLKELNKN